MPYKARLWLLLLSILGLIVLAVSACLQVPAELTYDDFSKRLEPPVGISSVTIYENPNDDTRRIAKVVLNSNTQYLVDFSVDEHPELDGKMEEARIMIYAIQEELTYAGFSAKLEKPGEVISVFVSENPNKDSGVISAVVLKNKKIYPVNFPLYLYPDLLERLEKNGITRDVLPASINSGWNIISFMLPFLLFAGIIFFIYRSQKRQMNDAASFAKNKTHSLTRNPKEKFSDVAGIEEVKEELEDIVDFLRYPLKYEAVGARIPRGVLLAGPPGTGKTLLARAIAGEAGVPFFHIAASEFVEMFVGVGASRVRDLFAQARQHTPSIVFIDEIDAVGRHRGSGLGHSHDEREQTLNQIFVEMDGFDERTNVIVLAATNRPDILDPALLRPKRFDRKVTVSNPDVKGREAILKVHTRNKPLASDVDLKKIAHSLPGMSGANLENLTNEAAIIAAKEGKTEIEQRHFFQAMDRILMGKEKKLVMSEKDKRLIANHEAGHAFVSKLLPGTDPVRKISIVARERSLGQTLQLPEEDRYITDEKYLLNWISVLLGGRVAEEIFLQTKSTGAEDDLRRATGTAQKMVCSWGMSKLGPRVFGGKEEEIFLGREMTRKEDVSEHTLEAIDHEVDRIVDECYQIAQEALSKNKEKFGRLVKILFEKETLEGKEIDELLK